MIFSKAKIKTWSRLGACGAYGMACMELPEIDDAMVACTADLCFYSGLDRFKQKYENRLYNVGIAEQNLLGIAAGLAKEGFHPFVSTYASFATTRALDQVRVNMGYMKLPIKLIGLTSGYSVGILGATHMSIEDMAIMRSIPNVQIVSPADTTETVKTILALANYEKPVYVRLTGTLNMPVVYDVDYEFEIGKAIELRQGSDVAMIATGTMVSVAIKVAEQLDLIGISAKVIDMHTIKPLDIAAIESCFDCRLIVTMEEHSKIGGLSSAVSEFLACKEIRPRQMMVGIDDFYPHAASYECLMKQSGLTVDEVYKRIKEEMER